MTRLQVNASFYSRYGKRTIDLVAGVILLGLLTPIMLSVYFVLLVAHGRPVLFRQRRPGLHGREFTMVKLRTMSDARGLGGELLPDKQRLTRFGRVLRASSLDELPQLWNVLRGDMSLVGPRPLLVEYLPRYTKEQSRRHDVLPGITGWAQINGRQDISFSKRIEHDVWYVEHVGLTLDLYILWRSCVIALCSSGVRSGQDVRSVDDLGLHDETISQLTADPKQFCDRQIEQPQNEDSSKEATDDADHRLDRAA